ncbi:MAG: hypothetical protein U1G07_19185 [Verrucomicrobiota bacterium]
MRPVWYLLYNYRFARLQSAWRRLPLLTFLGLWLSSSLSSQALDDAGLLYDRFPLTLDAGFRREILGPLLSFQESETERTWALSPLMSHRHDLVTDFTEFDFLYPILTYDRFGLDYRDQLFQMLSISGGETMDSTNKQRVTVFPFYFQQRSPDPELNYTALLPFYGHLKNRLFRDEIYFVMLPLYLQTRKKDVVTDNYLAPFFHLRHGNGLTGWQFWPVFGREHKEVTTLTNSLDEVEIVGGHDKLFALWPFYIRNDLGIGTTNLQTQRLYLPFYSAQRSPARDTTSYLWPLGFTYTDDRERKYREWAFPWPLIDFARGEGKTLNRVWPLFSRGKTLTHESDFVLWPVYRYNRFHSDPVDRQRTRILLFLYSDVVELNTETGTRQERTDLWPLFTARRDANGNKRLQLLAPLEPFLPASRAVERNYSPLWSIWRSESNAKTGAKSQSFLWNLYRRETTPTTRKCSLLFGLFHYQSGTEGHRWRLLYIPLGSSPRR